MKKYNYLESMIEIVLEYVRDEWDYNEKFHDGTDFSSREALEAELYDTDCGGAVDCIAYDDDAEGCLAYNLDYLIDAMLKFGVSAEDICKEGLCYADSLVRRYVLGDAIRCALDVLEANGEIAYSAAVPV